MNSILQELEKKLPKDAKISEVKFEGSNIVLYTKNKEFFKTCESKVRDIVRDLKKRVEVRADMSIMMDPEKTEKEIHKIVSDKDVIKAIYFEPELGKVVIESSKPGVIIGKSGETFRKIKDTTFWLPKIERAPAIDSEVVRAVRNLLHSEIDYRKKFLNKIGQEVSSSFLTEEQRRNEWVRLSFLGGARGVGMSSVLLQTKHANILMDCGIDPGSNRLPHLEAPEFDLEKLDCVVLTHSHNDHCAAVPFLYDQGFKGPLYCTPPVRDLLVLMCLDYIEVAQKEGKQLYYNKKAIEKTIKHTIALNYGEVTDVAADTRLTLQPSGHLLGSALVHLHIGEGLHNVVYTSDFKFGPTKLFEPAFKNFQRVETLIMESTYGGRDNILPPRKQVEENLMSIINKTVENGGKVLIPSFAVGRGQEVMCILADSNFKYPVYIDGMIWDATAIHTAYPEYLSRHLQKNIFHYGKNPFISDIFHRVVPKTRKDIIDSGDPCVVISTSGMLSGGPVMEYLKAFASEKKNTLVFVGYQGIGTMGRKIQKGWKEIPVRTEGGKTKVIRMEMNVETIEGLTGHSGRRQLMGYVRNIASKPDRVIINHGEKKRSMELAKDMHNSFRVETIVPHNLDAIRLV
ncbi:MAG: beta-CASP ribonuclease aCPSF1 [Candidatus Aenigmarchaeota archaeon]|nr:beta-CASP ribonuclease aCPSF1 [Candidatus Aenigmarchaeota archaeon]